MRKRHTATQKAALGVFIVGAVFVFGLIAMFGESQSAKAGSRSDDAELTEIKMQRLVRGFVLGSLKDPDSAKFRNQKGACGEVNAKNSFGGYAGFKRFIAAKEDLVFMEDDPALEKGAFQSAWDQFCK